MTFKSNLNLGAAHVGLVQCLVPKHLVIVSLELTLHTGLALNSEIYSRLLL